MISNHSEIIQSVIQVYPYCAQDTIMEMHSRQGRIQELARGGAQTG